MEGYEKYRIDNYWAAVRKIIPAESKFFHQTNEWDSTDTQETAAKVKNPACSGIVYHHNSLGYRGDEPDWSGTPLVFVGDENTKCVGVDDNHMWTELVGKKRGNKTINFGRDGASNEWIMAQTTRLIELAGINSPIFVVQWTDPRRFLFVDEKGRFRDFQPDVPIQKETLLSLNKIEATRKAFYDIETTGSGIHRLLLNSYMLDAFAEAMCVRVIQVFSFLSDETMSFILPRVTGVVKTVSHDHTARDGIHCGNAAMYRLSEWVAEKIEC